MSDFTASVRPAEGLNSWLQKLLPKEPATEPASLADTSSVSAPLFVPTPALKSREALIRHTEDIALALGAHLRARQAANDPHWWELAGVLDQVLDVLESVRAQRSA